MKNKKCIDKINNEDNDKFNKIYLGFTTRLIINVLLFIVFFSIGILFLVKSFVFVDQESISYNEKSDLNYRVYLKENDFYESDYLEKDMLYIANLIDRVNVTFNYNFNTEKNVNLDFNYSIIGKLVISDNSGKKSYFEKEYVLLENKKLSVVDKNKLSINEVINIDYEYYNDLSNRFKTAFGVDTSSNLNVYLVINKDSSNNNEKVLINNNSQMAINIPLSEKAIDIKMNYKEIDTSSNLISESNVILDNIIYMIIGVILIILSIIICIKIIRLLMLLRTNKSEYDKYVKKILNEYDRLIVETSTCPVIKDDNVIEINKFTELIDVRDNLKLPIMYYSVVKHHKCYFYITYENKIYLHIVKATDLEKNVN